MLHDCLLVKFQDVKLKIQILSMKFRENRHEAFILLNLFHNLFAINFSVVKGIFELFVVCHNSCLCIIFVLIVV